MAPTTFPFRLYSILDHADTYCAETDVISWTGSGNTFQIHDLEAFQTSLLPKYFPNQSKLKSFKRQLQYYGFTNYGRHHYGHAMFRRKQKDLLHQIKHKLVKKSLTPELPSPTLQEVLNSPKSKTFGECHHKPLVQNHYTAMERLLPPAKHANREISVDLRRPTLQLDYFYSFLKLQEELQVRSILRTMIFQGNAVSPAMIHQQLPVLSQATETAFPRAQTFTGLQLSEGLFDIAGVPRGDDARR